VRAVIFDLGNVLIHYEHAKTMTALAALGRLSTEQSLSLFREIDAALGLGQLDAAALHRHYQEHAGVNDDAEGFFTAFGAGLARNEEALAYAVELQQRPGVTVGVISNTNEAHVYWLDEYLPELAEFDLVMLSNEVGLAKPDPAIFELALELLDLPPHRTIFLDDLAVNVAAAQALGMYGLVHTDWAITKPALEHWLETGTLLAHTSVGA
jgi:epoxide hydrolase-like predicted phosphatase